MKRKYILARAGLIFAFLLYIFLARSNSALSASVTEREAIAIADLWYAMELNSGYLGIDQAEKAERMQKLQNRTVLYLVSGDSLLDAPPVKGNILAYVIKYKPSGFIVVSGDDRIQPIEVFDAKSEFHWDYPELNFLRYFVGKAMVGGWENLVKKKAQGIAINAHPIWSYLRYKLQESKDLDKVTFDIPEGSTYVLWQTAEWSQGPYYNDVVVANNGNIPGIPTGCTATAMAIKMRFHSWPLTGSSYHNYKDNEDVIQFHHFVNFGDYTYNWANMPTTNLTAPNVDIANLMYHCGVAVDMNYEVGGSGAWPTASSMNTYFRYKGTVEAFSSHETPMTLSIRGGLPVVCSSQDHSVCADGYREAPYPYFHLNVGWGSGGSWYDINANFPGGDPTIDRSYPYCSPQNYIYVDGSYLGSENGNIQNPYTTIIEGKNSVLVGGHLWIKAGTYAGSKNAPITLDKAMTVRSYGGTVIIGQ